MLANTTLCLSSLYYCDVVLLEATIFNRKCSSTNCLSHIQPHKIQLLWCARRSSDHPWLKSRNCPGSRPVNRPDLRVSHDTLSKCHKTTFSTGKQWWEILWGVIHTVPPATSYLCFSRMSQLKSALCCSGDPCLRVWTGMQAFCAEMPACHAESCIVWVIARHLRKKNIYSFFSWD